MSKFFYKLWSEFLRQFGNIKVFKFPMFMVYDPEYFKMTGEKIAEVMKILEPGDVILRGYDNYLDSKFIDGTRGYSHGAIYVGDNKIIHAIAKGVSEINVIEFCECDRICILRPKKYRRDAIRMAKKFLQNHVPYDYGFNRGTNALYCFELVKECYPKLDIHAKLLSKFLGLVKRNAYISDSFFNSKDMEIIFEYNPKYGVDFQN